MYTYIDRQKQTETERIYYKGLVTELQGTRSPLHHL